MQRPHILLIGFAKMTAPSCKNLPGRLSIPAALEIRIFFNSFRTISSVVGFYWNPVDMCKSLYNFFTESIPCFFGGRRSFSSNVSVMSVKNV